MVVIYALLFLLGVVFPAYGNVRVQAEADQVNHYENLPIPMTIIITHPERTPVDESSFVLDKNPIQPTKVKDVGESGGNDDILTIYRYELPAKKKGLYALPSIGVKVGGKQYQSIASTFEVKEMQGAGGGPAASQAAPAALPSGGAYLKLESIIRGPTTLFPGQSIVVGYRYSYNTNIETTAEVTPLFSPKGFLKVGDKIVDQKEKGSASILEITQQLQAQDPGVYEVGPSTIEGYAYVEDSLKRRSYLKEKLKSVVPGMTLTIKPVPAENQPASFNGAVGKFSFKAKLLSSPKVSVGDEMTLLAEITGSGDMESVQLPNLCCQPGMSGAFKLSDLPPVAKTEGQTKKFTVNLRPLTPLVKAIPSLEFSYFDPDAQKYVALHSDSIPISVSELKAPEERAAQPEQKREDAEDWRQTVKQPLPIQIGANYLLEPQDLNNLWFGSWWMLLLLPLAIFFLLYQNNLKRFLAGRKKEAAPLESRGLYEEAWKEPLHSSAFYAKLYRAFFSRLQERGDIGPSVQSVDRLPSEGAAGDVKTLLSALEQSRYAGDKGVREDALLEKARFLFAELEGKP